MRTGGIEYEEEDQYRDGRVWVHGADPFECVSKGGEFLRFAFSAGAENGLREKFRAPEGVRRELGIRKDRDTVAEDGGIAGDRFDRHRESERYASGDRSGGSEGRQDGDVREAAGTERAGIGIHG